MCTSEIFDFNLLIYVKCLKVLKVVLRFSDLGTELAAVCGVAVTMTEAAALEATLYLLRDKFGKIWKLHACPLTVTVLGRQKSVTVSKCHSIR